MRYLRLTEEIEEGFEVVSVRKRHLDNEQSEGATLGLVLTPTVYSNSSGLPTLTPENLSSASSHQTLKTIQLTRTMLDLPSPDLPPIPLLGAATTDPPAPRYGLDEIRKYMYISSTRPLLILRFDLCLHHDNEKAVRGSSVASRVWFWK